MVQVLYSGSKKYTAVLELLQIIYLLTLLRESEARSRSQPSQKVRVDPAPPHCTPDAYAPWALPTREAGRLSAVRAVMCIRVFSSISGPHPLNNRSIPHPQRDSQKCLQTWPSVPHLRATSVDLAATAWGFRTPCWLSRLQKAVQPRTVLPRFHASPPVGSVGIVVSISRGPQHLPTKYALTPNPPHASPASVAPRGGRSRGYLQHGEPAAGGQRAVPPHAGVHPLRHRLQPQPELVQVRLETLMLPGHLLQEVHSVLWEGGESLTGHEGPQHGWPGL